MTEPGVFFNLLDETLLSVNTRDGVVHHTLPGVLAALSRGEAQGMAGLRPHQRHAWHAFTVQLAVIALDRVWNAEALPDDEQTWRGGLLQLTAGEVEPWSLVVEDLARPAFMQPPVPEGSLSDFKGPVLAPDELDVLITSKNHDVKLGTARVARPEAWVLALLTLQTMEGFLGAGNYGIARMNGGFASRPAVGCADSLFPSERFSRDVRVIRAARSRRSPGGLDYSERGLALLWLEPWDGTGPLEAGALHHAFIEVCRRVRLRGDRERLAGAWTRPTKAARVDGKALNGVTGDPWTPIDRKAAKALTVAASGFSYPLVQDLLLGERFEHGATFGLARGADDGWLELACLVRGQGETKGYHRRTVHIPGKAVLRLGRRDSSGARALAARSQAWVQDAADMRLRVLGPAVSTLLRAGAPGGAKAPAGVSEVRNTFDAAVDTVFFPRLWEGLEESDAVARARWLEVLRELARAELDRAIERLPYSVARRYRAISAAEQVFGGAFGNRFGAAMEALLDPEASATPTGGMERAHAD